jgi:hypothetical protein
VEVQIKARMGWEEGMGWDDEAIGLWDYGMEGEATERALTLPNSI